jgi:hypothetical protein
MVKNTVFFSRLFLGSAWRADNETHASGGHGVYAPPLSRASGRVLAQTVGPALNLLLGLRLGSERPWAAPPLGAPGLHCILAERYPWTMAQ